MGSRLKRLRLAAAHSLRSHVCEPRSIFADVHAAGKNALNFICACGRKLCEAFSTANSRSGFPLRLLAALRGLFTERGASGNKFPGGVLRQRDAALIHNALVFLFELEKHLAARLGHAVAAQPQLFLVRRLFERGADEPIIGRIVIYIADGALAMLIRDHPRTERGLERCALRVRDAVFELPPFKSISVHGGVSFALMVLLYGDFLKSS